jgi:hypothetical protein
MSNNFSLVNTQEICNIDHRRAEERILGIEWWWADDGPFRRRDARRGPGEQTEDVICITGKEA